MPIRLGPFLGTLPRYDKTLLPENNAQVARDCYLKNGVLAAAQGLGPSGVTLSSNTKSFYRYNRDGNGGNGWWFQWDAAGVRVVPSPIANDLYRRVYFTGDGVPKYTASDVATAGSGPYPSTSYALGIPAPGSFTATGASGTPPTGTQKISTSYVMTYVDKYGAEGPPSVATTFVDRWDGAGSVSLTGLPVASGNFVIQTKRIYRIELQGVFQLVAEISAATTSYTDSIPSGQLSTVLPSETWLAPHASMTGLTSLPNGVMMGWWDNNLAFSEPYRPWAWPIEYRHALDDKIVGAALSDMGVLVATEGKPYLLVGAGPDSMSETKLDATLAGASARSVVDMGAYVVYASLDGLVANGEIITARHMTAEQFAELNPASFHAYRWNDRYLAFYENGDAGAFTFHPEEGFLWFSDHGHYAYQDPKTSQVFLKNNASTSVLIWNTGSPLSYTWRSKVFQNPLLRVPNCARVDADEYPVPVSFFADSNLLKSVSVLNRRAFRIPNFAHYDDLEIQITGINTVKSISIADQMSDL